VHSLPLPSLFPIPLLFSHHYYCSFLYSAFTSTAGIGKAICRRLLSESDDVYVIMGSRDARRGRSAVQDLLKEVGAAGSGTGKSTAEDRLECIELDVSSDESVAAAASKLGKEEPLYGIINNAGVS